MVAPGCSKWHRGMHSAKQRLHQQLKQRMGHRARAQQRLLQLRQP